MQQQHLLNKQESLSFIQGTVTELTITATKGKSLPSRRSCRQDRHRQEGVGIAPPASLTAHLCSPTWVVVRIQAVNKCQALYTTSASEVAAGREAGEAVGAFCADRARLQYLKTCSITTSPIPEKVWSSLHIYWVMQVALLQVSESFQLKAMRGKGSVYH